MILRKKGDRVWKLGRNVGVKIDRQGLAAALVSGERKVAVSGE